MTVSLARQWNTWDGRHPAAMVHLPTGLTVRLSAYSAKAGRYDRLAVGADVTLLEHTPTGDYVRLLARVADSVVELTFAKGSDPQVLVGRTSVRETGEWALRFWLCLEIGYDDVRHGPSAVPEDAPRIRVEPGTDPYVDPPVVTSKHRSTWHVVSTDSRPVFSGTYTHPDELRSELEGRGYYAPHADAEDGRWALLRFNGQANDTFAFAVASGSDQASATRRSREWLRQVDETIEAAASRAAQGTEAFRAIRDVVAWNTIWDVENSRPMTALTRNWLGAKFGGWGVWLDDVLFHALLAGYTGDWETAHANLDAALWTLAPDGNLPCLRTAYEEWVDRSQPPVAGYVLWRLHLLSGDVGLVEKHLPAVLRSHDWWFEARDGNGDGLLEFGSSPTGTGAFVHTKQAALDEAAMDNLPGFDEAEFDLAAHTIDLAEPALNSLLALEAEALGALLRMVHRHGEAARVEARGEQLARRIREQLWDPARGVFAGRRWNGEFAASLAPTSFYPWLCGAAAPEQTAAMRQVLTDESKFWGERVLPASTLDDPATADQVYWRGRVWPPLIFWVWEGLRRAGQQDLAREVLDRSWRMFLDGWRDRRCHENFHHTDPALDVSPDSDTFYGWGALLPLMKLMSEAEHNPWHGRVFAPQESPVELQDPGGPWRAERRDDAIRISRGGVDLVHVSHATRVAVGPVAGGLRVEILETAEEADVARVGVPFEEQPEFLVDGTTTEPRQSDAGWTVAAALGAVVQVRPTARGGSC